jgi:hypothetical protein
VPVNARDLILDRERHLYALNMSQGWMVVAGAGVGGVGAICAAAIAAWAARRQASLQADSQQDQWRCQIRRDTYGALLAAGAEARDELGSVFSTLRTHNAAPDLERLTERLNEARPLVHAVRRATAAVFVEGPPSMLEPAKRVEEGIIVFYTALTAVVSRPADTPAQTVDADLTVCGKQRVSVRQMLLDFATAARYVLDGNEETPAVEPTPVPTSVEELTWLLDGLTAGVGLRHSDISIEASLYDNGLDSLGFYRLTRVLHREHGLVIDMIWLMERGNLPLQQLAGHMAALRANTS